MYDGEKGAPNKGQLRQTIYNIFNDDLMIALAAILASAVIFQMVFEFSSGMEVVFNFLNYFIIVAFMAEYVLKLYVDESKISFVANPIHIFDLLIIILALFDFSKIGYVSFLPSQAQLSPILRLLRILPRILPRVLLAFFLAGRTAKRIDHGGIPDEVVPQKLKVSFIDFKGEKKSYPEENDQTISFDKTPVWIDFQNITEENFEYVEKISNVSHDLLNAKLFQASFPRIDPSENYLTMFLWDSQIMLDRNQRSDIFINNMLIVFNEDKVITLSKGKSQMFDNISPLISIELSKKSLKHNEFTDNVLYALLKQKLNDYSNVFQEIEQKTIEFEQIPVDKTSSKFLEETFHLKKEILGISENLWHFQQVLKNLINIKNVNQYKIDNAKEFGNLLIESEYLNDVIKNKKESLNSLIELHKDTVAYDMNRVMKVIAVITCLAIIPATVGGLLGVNLDEGNFHIKFIEIFFIVFVSILLGIYAFYKMEWLK
ncbi:MAG TPA: CorA family divalent cation transporter [Methanothrix sp.]|nr:CorA family divalent cation transporter [Methanothrix sp.]